MHAPESGPFPFLSRRSACCLPFPSQPGCWRVRPPSLTGLLCGCATLTTAALQQRQGLQRQLHVSPWLGPQTGREVTVFIEASAGPLGAGHGGLPYLPGAMQLFLGVVVSRLNYLFTRDRARSREWRCGHGGGLGGVDCMHSFRNWGWQPGMVGCGNWVAACACSWGWGCYTSHFSRVSRTPGIGKTVRGSRAGWGEL